MCVCFRSGDRILSLKVNFDGISQENALALLQHASSSTVALEVQKPKEPKTNFSSYNDLPPAPVPFQVPMHQKCVSYNDVSDAQVGRKGSESSSTEKSRRSSSGSSQFKSLQYLPGSKEEDSGSMELYNPFRKDTEKQSNSQYFNRKLLQEGVVHDQEESHYEIPNTMTVTAEINSIVPADAKIDKSITSDHSDRPVSANVIDPYAGLSPEDRMQLIRLSYEEPDLSRSTPNLSVSPAVPAEETLPKQEEPDVVPAAISKTPTSPVSKIPVSTLNRRRRSSVLHDLDQLETASGVSAMSSKAKPEPKQLIARPCRPRKRSSVNTSSGSSMVTNTDDSDRVSSPEDGRKSSGCSATVAEEELEKEQFEKLMYFQQQLERQHEELARLGVHIPAYEAKSGQQKISNGQHMTK